MNKSVSHKSKTPSAEYSRGHQHLSIDVKIEAMYPESRERVDRLMEAVRRAIDEIPFEMWGVSPKA